MNPWLVGHVISPLIERALRRRTFPVYRQMLQTQWVGLEELRRIQLEKLRELVAVALTTGYRDLAKLPPEWTPQSLDDLGRLPLLDKSTLSRRRESLVNRQAPGGAIRYNTGGSTGQPLIFYFDKRRQAADKAARMRAHQWWGVTPGQREAYLWGAPAELSRQDRMRLWRDRLTNEMLLSAFDLSAASVGWFVEQLGRFAPQCLFGYPSSIALLCKLARRAGFDLRSLDLRAVFCTAEVLYDHDRDLIRESFAGAAVADGYGSREGGFIAHECPAGRMHITADSLIVEFIRDGKPALPGTDGEIVVTHLDNYAMPFIRYRTGDVGQAAGQRCPCGRGLDVMQVVKGRTTDFVIAPDGRWVHGLALIYEVRQIPGIQQYQIIQHDIDRIQVRLVLDRNFPPDGCERIRDGIVGRLGQCVTVEVQAVAAIASEASGKFRPVISQVAKDREAML